MDAKCAYALSTALLAVALAAAPAVAQSDVREILDLPGNLVTEIGQPTQLGAGASICGPGANTNKIILTINWGDGSAVDTLTTDSPMTIAEATPHIYKTLGTFPLIVSATTTCTTSTGAFTETINNNCNPVQIAGGTCKAHPVAIEVRNQQPVTAAIISGPVRPRQNNVGALTVIMARPAPTWGTAVTFKTNNPGLRVTNGNIAQGNSSQTFDIDATGITQATNVIIDVMAGGVTKRVTVRVQ